MKNNSHDIIFKRWERNWTNCCNEVIKLKWLFFLLPNPWNALHSTFRDSSLSAFFSFSFPSTINHPFNTPMAPRIYFYVVLIQFSPAAKAICQHLDLSQYSVKCLGLGLSLGFGLLVYLAHACSEVVLIVCFLFFFYLSGWIKKIWT